MNVTLEVPYEANDLQDKRREDLVTMVQRQQDRWPFKEGRRGFTSKTNMVQMRAVLLNPACGFTKQAPAGSFLQFLRSTLGGTLNIHFLHSFHSTASRIVLFVAL
ncbi:hypothetical protein BDR05DRAFT_990215 [Suillus weaverae]|nr:hypothetical protein BDR05DRAFT_990215 [Suillus weaverae]